MEGDLMEFCRKAVAKKIVTFLRDQSYKDEDE
jgi:hypothetical protein